MEYEIEIQMYILKCRVKPWVVGKGKIPSNMSLSIKGGSKENIYQVDFFKSLLSLIFREAFVY